MKLKSASHISASGHLFTEASLSKSVAGLDRDSIRIYLIDVPLGTLILLVQAEGSFFSRSHFLRTIHFTYAPKNHKRSTKISMILVRCHTLRDFHKRSLFLRWL